MPNYKKFKIESESKKKIIKLKKELQKHLTDDFKQSIVDLFKAMRRLSKDEVLYTGFAQDGLKYELRCLPNDITQSMQKNIIAQQLRGFGLL